MSSSSKNIDVPADGLCFYHCIGAFLRSDTRTFRVDDALAIRSEVSRVVHGMGFAEEAVRLGTEGPEGYPDELSFAAAAKVIGGCLEVLPIGGSVLSYGEGPCRLRIHQTMTRDGAGHESLHFMIGYICHSAAAMMLGAASSL